MQGGLASWPCLAWEALTGLSGELGEVRAGGWWVWGWCFGHYQVFVPMIGSTFRLRYLAALTTKHTHILIAF